MKVALQHKTAFVMPTQNNFPKAIILLPVIELTSFHTIPQPKLCRHFILPQCKLHVSITKISLLSLSFRSSLCVFFSIW